MVRSVQSFDLSWADKRSRETTINARLIAFLKDRHPGLINRQIASVKFAKETFRPECCIRDGGAYHLLCIECKRLKGNDAKRLWKEGLSQALHYREIYKRVLLVLYDFTTDGRYATAFGRGNRGESRFRRWAREELGIHVIVLRPAAHRSHERAKA